MMCIVQPPDQVIHCLMIIWVSPGETKERPTRDHFCGSTNRRVKADLSRFRLRFLKSHRGGTFATDHGSMGAWIYRVYYRAGLIRPRT